MSETVTEHDVALWLRIGKGRVARFAQEGQLIGRRGPHGWEFDQDDVLAFVESCRIEVSA